MKTKYQAEVENTIVIENLHRLIGQIYKLLPYKEEGIDWEKPLETIQVELAGMNSLFLGNRDFHKNLLSLECKLEGLFTNVRNNDFETFRRTIFECIEKVKILQDHVGP